VLNGTVYKKISGFEQLHAAPKTYALSLKENKKTTEKRLSSWIGSLCTKEKKNLSSEKVLNVQLWSWNSPHIWKETISLVPFKTIMAPSLKLKQNRNIFSI